MKKKPFYFVRPTHDDGWEWDLRTSEDDILASDGMWYPDKLECLAAVERLKHHAPNAPVLYKIEN